LPLTHSHKAKEPKRCRTLIVDDHMLVRQGLKLLLGQDADIEVVGEASNGLEAIDKVRLLEPDVVVMDLLMPEMDGITATGEIKALGLDVEVLALTSVLEDASVVAAIKAGAIGYLLKDMQALNLCDCIKAAAQGQVQLAPEAAARLIREIRPTGTAAALTSREAEVMHLVSKGLSNAQIAEDLTIGEKTVKTHVSRILSKLDVKSRTQIAVHVWQNSSSVAGARPLEAPKVRS
jgi:two-component system, NarL family, response regulator LiaR